MSILLEKLGSRIRTLRQVKGYTQENMADTLGMSVSGYGKIERGESDVSLTSIEEVAQALGMSAGELLSMSSQDTYITGGVQQIGVVYGNGTVTVYSDELKAMKGKIEEFEKKLASLK